MRSLVNPPVVTVQRAREEKTNAAERTIIDDVVQLAILPGIEKNRIRHTAEGREGVGTRN
jgi:hypothetical protein